MISLCRTVRMTSYKDTSPLHKSFLGEKKIPPFLYLNFWQIKLFQGIPTSFQIWLMLYSPGGLHNQISEESVAVLHTKLKTLIFWRGTVLIQPHGDLAVPVCQNAMSQLHIVSHELMLLQGRYKVHHSKNPTEGGGSRLGLYPELQAEH